MHRSKLIRGALLSVVMLFFIVSVIIGLVAFTKESNKEAGVLTLQFNFTSLLNNALHRGSADRRNLFQPVEVRLNSVTGNKDTKHPNSTNEVKAVAARSLKTMIPEVVSQVQSVANTIATAIPAAVEMTLPRNFSIGTTQFCIGRANNISCHDLPPNISDILPAEIRSSLGDELRSIEIFDKDLANVTINTIQNVWIVGLVLMFLLLVSSLLSVSRWNIFQVRFRRVLLHLTAGFIICIPFLIPVVIVHVLRSGLSHLPSWIHEVQGDLIGLFTGGFCCVVAFIVFCGVLSAQNAFLT